MNANLFLPILVGVVCLVLILIAQDDYDNLKIGDHLQVVYLPDSPGSLRITSGARLVEMSPDSYRLTGSVMIVIAVFMAIIALNALSRLHH